MFNIQFENSNSDEIDSIALTGRLFLGKHSVPFRSSLDFWGPIDYELQWRRGIRTILEGGDRSCLITSITDPATSNFLMWWLIYRDDSGLSVTDLPTERSESATLAEPHLIFKNQVLMLDEVRSDFDLQCLEKLVPERVSLIPEIDDSELDQLLAGGGLQLPSTETNLVATNLAATNLADTNLEQGGLTLDSFPEENLCSAQNLFSEQGELDNSSSTFQEYKVTLASVRSWYESVLGI